jgi:hypothetical protein
MVRRSMSYRLIRLQLDTHATSTMVPHAPHVIVPPPVLRPDWETLARLAFKWSKLSDLDAYPTPSSLHQFCGTTDKSKHTWFCDPNQENITVILRLKSPNQNCRFWGPNRETRATGFEAKPEKTVATYFEVKPEKTVRVFWGQTTHKPSTLVLRLNQETRAPRLHVHGADRTQRHPTSRSPGHRVSDLCDHPRSSTTGLLLLPWSSSLHVILHLSPAHHETSKHDSPHDTKIKVKQLKYPEFKFKPRQVNDSSQSN